MDNTFADLLNDFPSNIYVYGYILSDMSDEMDKCSYKKRKSSEENIKLG